MLGTLYGVARRMVRATGLQATLGRYLNGSPGRRQKALTLYAATLVRPAARFLVREATASTERVAYTLAETGEKLLIRHGDSDVEVLAEIFGWRLYEPPAPVLAALAKEQLEVLDLGAHVGLFGLFARHRFPGCHIEAFEPDSRNRAVLERCIELNDAEERWRVVPACASSADGEVPFGGGRGAASGIDESSLERVRSVDVLPRIGSADLVKMDIEGGEWPILRDPRFRQHPPRVLAIEIHPAGASSADYVTEAVGLLNAAGLECQAITGAPEGAAMFWAWRRTS